MMNRLLSCLFIYKTRKEPVWFSGFYKNFTIVLRLPQADPHRLVQHLRDILADDQCGQAVVGRFIPVDERRGTPARRYPTSPAAGCTTSDVPPTISKSQPRTARTAASSTSSSSGSP